MIGRTSFWKEVEQFSMCLDVKLGYTPYIHVKYHMPDKLLNSKPLGTKCKMPIMRTTKRLQYG